jgi:hypothetical protein
VQHLELISYQSIMLYEIISDASWSTLDLENPNYNPHFDGIVGSTQIKATDLATSQMQKLVIQQPVVGPTSGSTTPTTQYYEVHFV